MFGSLGWQELLIIFAILALLFGGSRVAGLFGALGKGVREFRSEVKGADKKPDVVDSFSTANGEQPGNGEQTKSS